jgi:hypothetical protein
MNGSPARYLTPHNCPADDSIANAGPGVYFLPNVSTLACLHLDQSDQITKTV